MPAITKNAHKPGKARATSQSTGRGPKTPCTGVHKAKKALQAGSPLPIAARMLTGGRQTVQKVRAQQQRVKAFNEAPKGSGTRDFTTIVGAQAVNYQKYMRFNPLVTATPASVAQGLELFKIGYLYQTALLWQAMATRDDVLAGVIPKRSKDVQRRDWSIITVDDSPEAKRQAKILDAFWRSFTWVDSFDRNDRGKLPSFMGGLMTAHGYKYAAHHLIYQPQANGELRMEAEYIPLQFFENRTGELRHTLPDGLRAEGLPLDPTNWHVCKGDGLMEPCSVAYMFKHLPLGDMLGFSEKFGIPFIWGEAPEGLQPEDEGWGQLVETIADVMADNAGLFSSGTKLNTLDVPSSADLPFMPLVEYCNRAMNRLWRGSDLQGMSRDNDPAGASTSSEERLLMVSDDCRFVTDQLTRIEDKVAEYHGFDGRLAGIQVRGPVVSNAETDIKIDQFIIGAGGQLGIPDIMERYERRPAKQGEQVAVASAAPAAAPAGRPTGFNERQARQDEANVDEDMRRAEQADMEPIKDALTGFLKGYVTGKPGKNQEAISRKAIIAAINGGHVEDELAGRVMHQWLIGRGFTDAEAEALLLKAIHEAHQKD